MSRTLLAGVLLLATSVARAQEQADISLQIAIRPSAHIFQQEVSFLEVSLTNLGPTSTPIAFEQKITRQPDGHSGFPPIRFLGQVSGPCFIDPVGQPLPGDTFGFRITSEIEAGEMAICVYAFEPQGTEADRAILLIEASKASFGADPNLTNNQASVLLLLRPLAVPASEPLAVVVMVLLFAVSAIWAVRRLD